MSFGIYSPVGTIRLFYKQHRHTEARVVTATQTHCKDSQLRLLRFLYHFASVERTVHVLGVVHFNDKTTFLFLIFGTHTYKSKRSPYYRSDRLLQHRCLAFLFLDLARRACYKMYLFRIMTTGENGIAGVYLLGCYCFICCLLPLHSLGRPRLT